ncbi:MAG: hypothetical protein NTX79_03865 [Candidatus Micrarchaeota archaeon]|nr:hypothetical protein [Candidatus Micrarchaeota archaeon]
MSLGFELRQTLRIREPVFKDIPLVRRLTMPSKPSRVVLLSPHTSEHPTTLPFQRALAEKLERMGVKTEQMQNDDGMEIGWSIRKKISAGELADSNKACGCALGIWDYLQRVRQISDIFAKYNGKTSTYVMEVHAMNSLAPDDFFPLSEFKRLANTPILIQYFTSMNFESIREYNKELDENERRFASDIATQLRFNLVEAMGEIQGRLRDIKKFAKNVLLIEVPGMEINLPPNHPAFSLYFKSPHHLINAISNFEYGYCISTRETIWAEKDHADAVANIFLLPKIKRKLTIEEKPAGTPFFTSESAGIKPEQIISEGKTIITPNGRVLRRISPQQASDLKANKH